MRDSERDAIDNELGRRILGISNRRTVRLTGGTAPGGGGNDDRSRDAFINPMTGVGDIIVGTTSGSPDRLGPGSDGDVLTVQADGTLAWEAGTGGGSIAVSDTSSVDLTLTGGTLTADVITEWLQDTVAAMLTGGTATGITVTYQDASGTIDLTVTGGGGYTDEQVRDVIAAALVAGTGVTITVDDALDTITISASVTSSAISDFSEAVDDRVSALLVAGNNIDITYNDAGNTLTIDVESLTTADITDFTGAVDDLLEEASGDESGGVEWLHNHRYGQIEKVPGSTSIQTYGAIGGGIASGTASNVDDTDGAFLQYLSVNSAGASAGRTATSDAWRADWGMTFAARMKTGADVTSVATWVGLSETNLSSGATPTGECAAFRAVTSVPDTNWKAITCNSTGCTVTDTGVAFSADSAHWFRCHFGTAKAKFYIDDVLVATHTTAGGDKLPAGGIGMGWYLRLVTLAAAARAIKFGRFSVSSRN